MIILPAVGEVVVVGTLVTVSYRTNRRHAHEMKIAQALGENVGMKAPELAAMFHPKATYDHQRLMMFTFHIPARLVGELEVGEKRVDAEKKMRGTIRGLMGHVAVEIGQPHSRRAAGTVTLTRAEIPKPVPMSVDADDLH